MEDKHKLPGIGHDKEFRKNLYLTINGKFIPLRKIALAKKLVKYNDDDLVTVAIVRHYLVKESQIQAILHPLSKKFLNNNCVNVINNRLIDKEGNKMLSNRYYCMVDLIDYNTGEILRQLRKGESVKEQAIKTYLVDKGEMKNVKNKEQEES